MDSAAFTEGLSQAQKKLQDAGSRLKAIGTKMAGIGLAAGAAMGGAFAAVTKVTGGLVELGNEAKTAGVAFEEFQKLKYVADQAGVSIEALTDGMKEMQLRADEFATTGGGSAAEAFERIGLSGADLTEALKNPAAMFDDIVARIGKLDTAAQIRVADEIFGGTGGEQFVRLLDLGADGIAKLKEEFVANGGLIPQEQLAKAQEFQQAMGKLKASLTGLGTNALMNSGLIEFFTAAIPQVMAFGKAMAETLGPKLKPLIDGVMAMFRALGEVIIALFGGEAEAIRAVQGFGTIIAAVFDAAVKLITGAVEVVTNVLRALAALLRGDFSTMWDALGSAAKAVVTGIGGAFEALFPNVISSVSRMVTGVRDWLVTRFASMVVEPVRQKIEQVKGFFFNLYDAVVGNSYVPDMVVAIAEWMGPRLHQALVVPAQAAVAQTNAAFASLATPGEGPLTGMAETTRQTADAMSHAMQGVVGAVDQLSAGLANLGKEGSAGLVELLATFVRTIAQIIIQMLALKAVELLTGIPVSALLGGAGEKGPAKGIFGFKLPGFARGGGFNVAGSGTTDSKIVAFRATPGERVDISTPRQQRQQGGGGASVIHVAPSRYFDVHVQHVVSPMVGAAAVQSARAGSSMAQSQMYDTARYTRGR